MAKLRCYALPGPLWDLRKAESEVFVKALPRGVWPLSSRSPASPLMGAREVWASAISVEEHADPLAWVDSVRVLHASIRKHEPPSKRRPFVVLVDADFPDRFSESLESDGIEVVRAESVHVPDFWRSVEVLSAEQMGFDFSFLASPNITRLSTSMRTLSWLATSRISFQHPLEFSCLRPSTAPDGATMVLV